MAFPTTDLITDTSTHTIGENTWKWNGYAWDRQASAVSGDTHGHTGETVVDSFNGLTGDVTTNALVLPVAGISSSGGATFADPIFVPNTFNLRNSNGDTVFDVATRNLAMGDVDGAGNSNTINIRDSHNAIYLNAESQIRLNAPDVYIESGGQLGALSDTDTHIHFAGADVKNFLAGGVTYAQGTATGLVLPAGLSASGGATFSENVSVGATLSVDNDIVIGNGRDLIFDGSSSSEIQQNGSVVALFAQQSGLIRFPIYSVQISQFLAHNDDSDTHLEFKPDQIKLTAGDNTGLDMTATETTIDGVTFTDGKIETLGDLDAAGATFTNNVTLTSSSSDIALTVKADTDNNNENDNPLIRLEQDGGAISTSIGMNGDDDAQFSGSIANMFYIEADGSAGNHTHGIQFATANTARMTIASDGNVGINEKFPAQRLDVDGIIQAQTGITLGAQGITFNDGTNMTTAASGSGSSGVTQSIGFILDGNGSPITVGDKLDALKQVPISSYLLNTSAYVQDGVTATTNEISFSIQRISSIPRSSSAITGTTLDLGVTGSVEQGGFTFMGGNGHKIYFHELADVSSATGSEISADDWLYPSVLGNSGDINKLQIFLTVVPT